MIKKINTTILLLLLLITFLSINLFSGIVLRAIHIDLTEDKLYTLSSGSYKILRNLKEPITLRFIFSEKLSLRYPVQYRYGNEIRDLLGKMSDVAAGNLWVEFIDPEPFSTQEDRAVEYGLSGLATNAGETIYFGLSAENSIGERQAIAYFAPQRHNFVEYDIIRLIDSLNRDARIRVGVVSDLPLDRLGTARPGQKLILLEELENNFALKYYQSATITAQQLQSEVDILLLIQPAPGMPENSLYAIDQFILSGGRAIIMVDPAAQMAISQLHRGVREELPLLGDLAPLFAAWGVGYKNDVIIGDRKFAIRVNTNSTPPKAVDYVIWLRMNATGFNRDDPVLAKMNLLTFASAGHFTTQEKKENLNFTPLLQTSNQAMLFRAGEVLNTQDPEKLLREFAPDGQHYIISARLDGAFPSAYPDAPPKGADQSHGHLGKATKNGVVVLVGDTDMLDDRFWVQVSQAARQPVYVPTAENGNLILNWIEYMSGSDALIGLRSRGYQRRNFTRIEDLQKKANQRFLAREQGLREKLSQAESRLRQIESQNEDEEVLNRAQQLENQRFRDEVIKTRQELREVRRSLNAEIDQQKQIIRVINIAAIPLFVGFVFAVLPLLGRWLRRLAPMDMGKE